MLFSYLTYSCTTKKEKRLYYMYIMLHKLHIKVLILTVLFLVSCNTFKEGNGPVLKWKFNTAFQIFSSPAIDNKGNIYFGSQDRHVYALDPNGNLIWKKLLGRKVNSSPVIYQDKLYVGSQDTYFYTLSLLTGDVIHRFKTNDSVHASAAIDFRGNVYFGSYDGVFYSLENNGDLRWSYKTAAAIDSSPSIDSRGNVYVASTDNNVYSFKNNGELRWKFPTESKLTASPAIGGTGIIYIGSHDKKLYAISASTGKELWNFETNGKIISSVAIGSNNTLYFGSLDEYLYAVDESGKLLWKRSLRNNISSSPAIGKNGYIYVGSFDHNLYMISPTGNVVWSYNLGDYIASSPNFFVDGSLYVGSTDNTLYAFKTSSLGHAISSWPGRGGGPSLEGRVKNNLANVTRPYFEIAKIDTLDEKTNKEFVPFARSRTISTALLDDESYLYEVDTVNQALAIFTFTDKGKIEKKSEYTESSLSDTLSIAFNEDYYLLAVEDNKKSLDLFDINKEDGNITIRTSIEDTIEYEIENLAAISQIQIDKQTLVFAAGKDDHGISSFQLQDNAVDKLINVFNVDNAENFRYSLNTPTQLNSAYLYGKPFLIVSSQLESGITLFRVNKDGSLQYTDSVFDLENNDYFLQDINSFSLVSEGTQYYLVGASKVENGISVFRISESGSLDYVSSLDFSKDKNYNIQKLEKISTLEVANNFYLVVYDQSKLASGVFTISGEGVLFQFSNDDEFENSLKRTTNIAQIQRNSDTYLVFANALDEEFNIYKVLQ